MRRLHRLAGCNWDKVRFMKHLRKYKRLWLVLLALMAGSLHVQTVYACSEMGERLQTACCCEEADSEPCGEAESCDVDLLQAAQACCEVSYSAALDDEAMFALSAQPGKSGVAPLALPPSNPAVLPVGTGMLIRNAAPSFDSRPAAAIYLSTRRLRI